jgi:UDP-3-O-[3-hydroxymyristoyl] N-acetylglucosamine deacetylase
MRSQATLSRSLHLSGIGLHSGRHVDVVLHPAPVDHGVVFHRTDVDRRLPALVEEAGALDHATTLGPRGAEIGTVEHLLSAAAGLGLDNLLVEVNGPEVPILDGSAAPWLSAFRQAGLQRQAAYAEPFVPSRTISVSRDGKRLEMRPARELRITYTIDFPHRAVGRQSITVVVTPETYARHVAPARTFGFLAEYEQLKAHGLARGASLANCIVIGEEGVENGTLRFPDELVRHKVLDLIGDLALVGRPVLGHVIAHRAGHAMHAALARALRNEVLAATPLAAAGR